MKISASNIAWTAKDDNEMYAWLKGKGVEGLEIAPTRIFVENPYDALEDAKVFSKKISEEYGLTISSMQSIWYGRSENIFASESERKTLIDYTKKTIDFAEAVGCKNLVFGCPRNRSFQEGEDVTQIAIEFFGSLGDYAKQHGTVLAMEANPPIYNTNFCNTTSQAVELIKRVNSDGFKLNLDIGTMIYNDEDVSFLAGCEKYINHVHVSEPGLVLIQERKLHEELAKFLRDYSYDRFVSLEIKTQDNLSDVKNSVEYIKKVFG